MFITHISYSCGPRSPGWLWGQGGSAGRAGRLWEPALASACRAAEPSTGAAARCHIPSTVVVGQQALCSIRFGGQRAGRPCWQHQKSASQQPVPISSHHFPSQVPRFAFWPSTFPCSHHFVFLLVCFSSPPCFLREEKTAFSLVSAFPFKATARQLHLTLLIFVLEGKVNNHPPCLGRAPPAAAAFPG